MAVGGGVVGAIGGVEGVGVATGRPGSRKSGLVVTLQQCLQKHPKLLELTFLFVSSGSS